MKNYAFLAIAGLSILSCVQFSHAQSSSQAATVSKTAVKAFGENLAAADADAAARAAIKSVNEKAFRDFSARFKDASDIRMINEAKGLFITCVTADKLNRVMYSPKGRWIYTTKQYDHTLLDAGIRERLTEAYPNYDVFGSVMEVYAASGMAHLVLIENKNSWKRIKVVGDAMEEYEAYQKSR